MMIGWWLLAGGVVALLVWALGRAGREPRLPEASPAPEGILAERYARGEIDETEYRVRLAVLKERR